MTTSGAKSTRSIWRGGTRARWRRAPLLFLLPAVVYVLIFFAYPVVFGLVMSVEKFDFQAIVNGSGPFVGLQNYRQVFSDPIMGKALTNTAIFTVGSIFFQFWIGFALAALLVQRFPLRGFFRSLILLPWLVPLLASGTIFKLVFAGDNGLINMALRNLHIIDHPIYWLSDPRTALMAVTAVNVWIGLPFNAMILYSGLQDFPVELKEAALVDGAGPIRRFWSITLPVLKDVILILLMLDIISTVKAFDVVIAMTGGGPDNATQLMSTWAYRRAFGAFDFGTASAIGNILLIFCLLVGILYIRETRKSNS